MLSYYQTEFEVSSNLIGRIDSTRRVKEEPVLILEKIPFKEDPLNLIFLVSYKKYGNTNLLYDDDFLVYNFGKRICYEATADRVNEIMEKVHIEPENYKKTKLVLSDLKIPDKREMSAVISNVIYQDLMELYNKTMLVDEDDTIPDRRVTLRLEHRT